MALITYLTTIKFGFGEIAGIEADLAVIEASVDVGARNVDERGGAHRLGKRRKYLHGGSGGLARRAVQHRAVGGGQKKRHVTSPSS